MVLVKLLLLIFFINKLALLIFIYHLLDIFLNYSDCPITVMKCILFYLLISDNNVIGQVLNLLCPITFVYKSFKNKAKRILYILQCYVTVKYFIEPFLNVLLRHGDIETNPGPRKKKKTLWPLFMYGVQLPQGYSHFEEAVYFLPFSSQKFLVLI